MHCKNKYLRRRKFVTMKFIQGNSRTQTSLFPVCLDESIDQDNEIRLIDLFVDSLSLEEYGFKMTFDENGRPAYHPGTILKLYIYGYMNKVRSSRDLEKECKRNIEVMWLLHQLAPDHNTISNFRRDNGKAIKKVFQATVKLAKHFNLIGGKLIAGDSTKLRAQNSKKNNYNEKKIERHLQYIDNKLDAYENELAKNDGDDSEGEANRKKIQDEINKHQERKQKYQQIQKQIDESGQSQVSTSDPESRQMIIRNNITEVAYNVQTTTDEKHNIPIDYKTTNNNDSKAMGPMLERATSILGHNDFITLYDKGYHTGSEFKAAHDLGIEVLVAIPGISGSSQAPDTKYNVENFNYDKEKDCYYCPGGETLTTNGTWYKRDNANRFMQYKTPACKTCKVKQQCTTAKAGKIVQRGEYASYVEANKKRVESNHELYRKRQAIVEHPYGTIKRQWGFSYILTKQGIDRAEADVGLMFIAYNLRRIINLIGFDKLKEVLGNILANLGYKLRKIISKLNINRILIRFPKNCSKIFLFDFKFLYLRYL